VALIILVTVAGYLLANPLKNPSQNTAVPANAETALTLVPPTWSTDTQATELPIAAALPTVKYPEGKRFMLFYNDNSLYLLNLSESTIPINWIAFERLSDADLPMNRFSGAGWAEFYPDSTPGRCVALRILDSSPYLDPPECGHNYFLSLRTPTRDDPILFWTSMESSHQFRVLWREGGNDEEIARCEISAGTCEVFLP
jgi:hypothetical protein